MSCNFVDDLNLAKLFVENELEVATTDRSTSTVEIETIMMKEMELNEQMDWNCVATRENIE
jgi:hypothetical protein